MLDSERFGESFRLCPDGSCDTHHRRHNFPWGWASMKSSWGRVRNIALGRNFRRKNESHNREQFSLQFISVAALKRITLFSPWMIIICAGRRKTLIVSQILLARYSTYGVQIFPQWKKPPNEPFTSAWQPIARSQRGYRQHHPAASDDRVAPKVSSAGRRSPAIPEHSNRRL